LITPCLTLPLLYFGGGAIAVTVVLLLSSVLLGLADMYTAVRKYGMHVSFKHIDFGLMKQLVPFTFFVFLNMIVEQINWSIDKFIIGRFWGTALVAVYTIGAQINSYYREFSTSISSVFTPRINKLVMSESKDDELTALMTRVGRIQFMVLALILTGFMFFGKFFVERWAGKDYTDAYYVALILMFPITVPLCQNIAIEVQRAKNMHQFRALVYIGMAVLNLILTLHLCPRYGILGSAVGTSIVIVLGHIIIINIFYHTKLGLNMKYYWSNLLKILPGLVIPIALGVVMNLLIVTDGIMIFIIKVIIYSLIYFLSIWKISMNVYEKDLVRKLILHSKVKAIHFDGILKK
jgi:O-antigen/teichoic acid export membrane protein